MSFWNDFVPASTKGEPYAVVINGDALDGVHHGSTTQWSHNLTDQGKAARDIIAPLSTACDGRLYMIRGTEAHVGQSGQDEERLAMDVGAIPNKTGQRARYDLWKLIGPRLVHFTHHIGTTGSQHYESTAVHRELMESFLEAGRWNRRPPDVIIRGHRHRYIETGIPTANGEARAVVTPGWQGKTPFAWKVAGARQSEPQFGGVLIRWSEDNQELFVRSKVWSLEREEPE